MTTKKKEVRRHLVPGHLERRSRDCGCASGLDHVKEQLRVAQRAIEEIEAAGLVDDGFSKDLMRTHVHGVAAPGVSGKDYVAGWGE